MMLGYVLVGLLVSLLSYQPAASQVVIKHNVAFTFLMGKTNWGSWSQPIMCNHGVRGFRLQVEKDDVKDDTALNGIQLICRKSTRAPKIVGPAGKWGETKQCAGNVRVTAFSLRSEGDQGTWGDDRGATNVAMKCSAGEQLIGDGEKRGTWARFRSCPHKTYFCGVSAKIEGTKKKSLVDDTGVNQMKFFCCKEAKVKPTLTQWSSFSKCSKSCGGGVSKRTRSCSTPRHCAGALVQYAKCFLQACPDPDGWKLQQSNVCFGARDNQFGAFTMKQSGTLVGIKLVHKSGFVACKSGAARKSNWGCGGGPVSIAVTDDEDAMIFPDKAGRGGWITVLGYNSKSKDLVLNKPAKPFSVDAGTEMKLWYGEDFTDSTEGDNSGRSCADVYAVVEDGSNCASASDVMFAIDASGSVKGHFAQEKEIVKSLSKSFGLSRHGGHSGVITFSTGTELSIGLNEYYQESKFDSAVDEIKFLNGHTMIDDALKLAEKAMKGPATRKNAPKVVVLITDGSQTKWQGHDDPAVVAARLRSEGINTVVIGIGSLVNRGELQDISGANKWYTVKNWKSLKSPTFINKLTNEICTQ